jgi:hypothetical protein
MPEFYNPSTELKLSRDSGQNNSLSEAAQSLYREAKMISLGCGGALVETALNPMSKLPELAGSMAFGSTLGVVSRLGASGRIVAAAVGTSMTIKFVYDELSANRWSKFGGALKDAWQSADNMDENIRTTRESLGSLLVDTAIGYAGMKVGSLATSRFAAPEKLLADAVRRSNRDGGAALRSLQNRWEDPSTFKRHAEGKLDLITYSQPASPGQPRGDLVRVETTPEGKVLLAAMDVEGHGIKAAKKAVSVHAAIDQVLPLTKDKSASDILSMIDGKLSSQDELSITAALMTYNPVTRSLETATASSQFAFVVRANGKVQQLDAKAGGLGLGTDMYSSFPRGNEVIRLNKGDTAVMASDGVFDRFGYGNARGFETFLKNAGSDPQKIRRGILSTPPPENGIDDASFIIFRPLERTIDL